MKFKLNRGKSIKFGDKEIPISKTDGWTDIPDDLLIDTLSDAVVQADLNQDDKTAPDYVKNRPFWTEKPPIITDLGNTYDVWDKICSENGALNNPQTNVDKATLSFVIEGELYENVTPKYFSSAYVYNYITGKYNIVVYVNSSKIECFSRGEKVTDWQIVSISDKEKIHYIDPKYIEDMYYTEKGPFVEELGNTYDAWLSIVGSGDYTSDTEKMAVSIKVDDDIYENVIPKYLHDSKVWTYNPTSEIQIAIRPSSKQVMSSLSSLDGVSFVIISKEDRVHKIPEKYYDKNENFVFVLSQDGDGNWITNRTRDEVVKAIERGAYFEPIFYI